MRRWQVVRWATPIMLACTAAATAAPDVKTGISAWSAGDYAKAVTNWRPLAATGNSDAQFNLAQAFKMGRGVPINLATAQRWYERAARQGHRDAQTSLGLTLFGNGDRIGAMRWLRLAAEGGEPRAMLVYGTALFNGDGVVADKVRAYALISRAAAQGLVDAATTLDEMDTVMPVEERQRGVAMAQHMASRSLSAKGTMQISPAGNAKVPVPIRAKPTAGAASGPWRIQLGAFGQRTTAEALYRRLSASGQFAGRQPMFTQVGAVTRLQIGPYPTRAAAGAACDSLESQACFPVK